MVNRVLKLCLSIQSIDPDGLPSIAVVAGPDELLHVDSVAAAAVLALVVRVLVEHDAAARRAVGGPQGARTTEQIVEGLNGSGLGGGGGHTIIIILRVGEVDPVPPGVPGAGDGCPRVRALPVHLKPRVQLLLLGLGTRLVLRHSRRRRFLLYSSSGLVFLIVDILHMALKGSVRDKDSLAFITEFDVIITHLLQCFELLDELL